MSLTQLTPPAVILLSGGLDSSTVLAMTRKDGYACHALSFRYGQRHLVELAAARRVAQDLGAVQHLMMELDLRLIGGSALTSDLAVPKDRPAEEMAQGVPVTYVPARNTLFLSLALAWAETLDCTDIFIGINALDYSDYPDCRPAFVAAFQEVANLGTRLGAELGALCHSHPADKPEQGPNHRPGLKPWAGLRYHPLLLRPRPPGSGLRRLRFLPTEAQGLCPGRCVRSPALRRLRIKNDQSHLWLWSLII
ncbi:7-cyano-7-deazaguanine synthase [Desulfarculales bacterium]